MVCDRMFTPAETFLAKRRAKSCCCCVDTRLGTLIGTALAALYMVAELSGSFTIYSGLFFTQGDLAGGAVLLLVFLPGALAHSYAFYCAFKRQHKGLRLIVRYQMAYIALLICAQPVVFYMVRVLCRDIEATLQSNCEAAPNATACQHVGVFGDVIDTDIHDTSESECVWAQGGACQPMVTPGTCNTEMVEFGVLALVFFVTALGYLLWVSNSYTLVIEEGAGARLSDDSPA